MPPVYRDDATPPVDQPSLSLAPSIRLSLDEHAFATHSVFDPPPQRKQHLPRAIEEILSVQVRGRGRARARVALTLTPILKLILNPSVQSSEWLEAVSPTQCALGFGFGFGLGLARDGVAHAVPMTSALCHLGQPPAGASSICSTRSTAASSAWAVPSSWWLAKP